MAYNRCFSIILLIFWLITGCELKKSNSQVNLLDSINQEGKFESNPNENHYSDKNLLSKNVDSNVNNDLNNINSDTLNVKSFGAIGDGSTNDGNAIQKAINALKENQVLFIPKGIYLITQTLTVKSNITIMGDGNDTRLQYKWGKYSDNKKLIFGFIITNSKNIVFKNFHIDGGASNYYQVIIDDWKKQTWNVDGAYHLFLIKPERDFSVSNVKFENLKLSNSFFDAIHTYARVADKDPKHMSKDLFVKNCYFSNIGCHGIGVGLVNNVVVENSQFKNVGLMKILNTGMGSGMAVDASAGSENVVIRNNLVDGAGAGFKTETHKNNSGRYLKSKNVIIEGNTIKNLYSDDAFKIYYGIKANGLDVKIINNIIESYSHGILLGPEASNCEIIGNSIIVNRSDAAGIRVDKNGGNHKLIRNQIRKSNAQGILVANSNNILIKSNIIVDSRLDNIRIAGGRNISIENNLCANAGTSNISVFPLKGMSITEVTVSDNTCFDVEGNILPEKKRLLISGVSSIKVLNNKLISDNSSSLKRGSNNNISESNGIPKSGTFQKGDFIPKKYNDLNELKKKSILGWICTESGSPGLWAPISMKL